MINKDIYQALQQLIPNEKIKVDEPLKRYTYTKTGGNADFILPTKNEEVQAVVKYAYQNEIPVTYLGNGQILLSVEGGVRGIVISLLSPEFTDVSDDAIIAGSGAAIIGMSLRVARYVFFTGLEFACGIPGSPGGAGIRNAGAMVAKLKIV